MLTILFGLTNLILLATSCFSRRLPQTHRKFSLAILQTLFFLPLLVAEYLVAALNLISDLEGFTILLASQNLFLVIWSTAGRRLLDAMSPDRPSSAFLGLIHTVLVALILLITAYQISLPSFVIAQEGIHFAMFGSIYFASIICLMVMLFMAWQMEAFWRQLPKSRRREYGLFVVGSTLVCIVQGGVASYRLTYLELTNNILFLQASFLLFSWILLAFAVLRNRLLNRDLFISRKIVYSFVAPSIFAAYFLLLGIISLVMRFFGYPLEWVLFWLFLGIGAVVVAILAFSEGIRQRLKFFISTHFYVYKYEFRDEWIAFSALLQTVQEESQVLGALRQVLVDSLYTKEIWIWSGNETDGFQLVVWPDLSEKPTIHLAAHDPLIRYIRQQPRLDLGEKTTNKTQKELWERLTDLPSPKPVLFVPLTSGGQLVGCIGLGQEYTGGRYGQDDFDLLAALSSQAASALLAVRLMEETARLREQRALQNLSVFLIHDVKNAASILSLIHTNAKAHMDNPEFRKDMLIAVNDALQRMNKVHARLSLLRDQVVPVFRDVHFCIFLNELLPRFNRQLVGLEITLDCPKGIMVRTDPQLLETVMENIILNAYEACNGKGRVQLTVTPSDDKLIISILNDGPAIPENLLPDGLFQPFVSMKPGGSGIGLWQVRLILKHLEAAITADNPAHGGARFVIHLPDAVVSPRLMEPINDM